MRAGSRRHPARSTGGPAPLVAHRLLDERTPRHEQSFSVGIRPSSTTTPPTRDLTLQTDDHSRATEAASRVPELMPELERGLAELVAIPSVSATDYPEETHGALLEACSFVQELLRDAGVEQVGTLELPHTAPIVVGEIPAPPGAPTVLLYSHYDVVPAGDEERGTRRRSRRRGGTTRSSDAAPPTPSRTSWRTSVRSGPGRDGCRSGSRS